MARSWYGSTVTSDGGLLVVNTGWLVSGREGEVGGREELLTYRLKWE